MIPEHIWRSGIAERWGVKRWIVFLALVDLAGEIEVDEKGELVELKEVSVAELGLRTGLGVEEVRRVMKWLQNQGVVSYYEPESEEEEMVVRIWGIREFVDVKELRGKGYTGYLKYVDGEREKERSPVDVVVDMYISLCGGTYRSDPLVVMRLQELASRFALVDIRGGFEEARKRGIKSLDSIWIFCEEKERRRKENARGGRRKR